MKPSPSSEHDEQDQEMIELLKELGSSKSEYPPELLTARRAAFLAHVDQLTTVDTDEELSAEDQEVANLLGRLKSIPIEYPPELLAARRSAFLRQMERIESDNLWSELRVFIQRIIPRSGFMRLSLVIGSLIAAVWIGSLFLRSGNPSFQPLPLQATPEPTAVLPNTGEVAITICKPEDQMSPCPSAALDQSQDLADPKNGTAQPAVSKDAHSNQEGVHRAAYVNDGREGASWVSNSPDSWIKIDLGQVQTINTVSLQKGSIGSSYGNDPGQFVIAVSISDVYADGDSSDDYVEYAQVFHSKQTGFSGTVSQTETIQTWFPPVKARFIKITFEKTGAAIDKVGVFMLRPPEQMGQATRTPRVEAPETMLAPVHTDTQWAMNSATSEPTGTQLLTNTSVATLTHTPKPSNTPTPLPTNTLPPTYTSTSTPLPKVPFPSNTPIPSPTAVPPTAIPATLPPPPPTSADTIVVTGSGQTLTFTCNGNAAEIRGHANTVTLLGACSSIVVSGNGNRVYWESGSPVITNRGKDNIIQQL